MRSQQFTIPNRLASFDEYIQTGAHNMAAFREREKHNVHLALYAISHARPKLEPCRKTVTVHIHWVEPDSHRKHANVAAGACQIERALVSSGLIRDHVQVNAIYSTFAVNPENPRVIVTLEED